MGFYEGQPEPIRPAQGGEMGRARDLVGKVSLIGDQETGNVGYGVASGTDIHFMFLSRQCPMSKLLPWWSLWDKALRTCIKISFSDEILGRDR